MRAAIRIPLIVLIAALAAACVEQPVDEPTANPPGTTEPAASPSDSPESRTEALVSTQPPSASLVVDDVMVPLHVYTYCWTVLDTDGTGVGQCSDGVPLEGPPEATLERGAKAALNFDGNPPEEPRVTVVREDPLAPGTELEVTDGTVVLDLEPGAWYVKVSGQWEPEGDAFYSAAIEIAGPDGDPTDEPSG